MRVIATAGHVDHGKSTLVRALTGMEPDRWAEERRRGMTIDLGFAWAGLATGEPIAFVDVPGHQRFVTNMLAGVGPVPAVMFVIAADRGWGRQSSEHLDAIDALRIEHGLLVITRADLASPEKVASVIEDARARLAGTGLAGIEAVAVSSVTGQGLPELKNALQRLVNGLPAPVTTGRVRLWVDRCFTVAGAGTVVTGTLGSGQLAIGDQLQLKGKTYPIRGLQALGEPVDPVTAVARVAVNLRGLDRRQVARGDCLLTPGAWSSSDRLDVRLEPLLAEPAGELVLHLGSAAIPARFRPLGTGVGRLSLARPIPVRAGDRAVLRDPGQQSVVGGVLVLDPDPPALNRRGAARARGTELSTGAAGTLAAQVRRRGAVSRARLAVLGFDGDPSGSVLDKAGWLVDPATWQRWLAELAQAVDEHARAEPQQPRLPIEAARRTVGIPDQALLRELATEAGLVSQDGRLGRPGTEPALGPAAGAIAILLRRLEITPFAAPEHDELVALGLGVRELATAARAGLLLRLAPELVLAADAVQRAIPLLAGLGPEFSTSQARAALGTTRRVAIPLLEHLDLVGVTVRLDPTRRALKAVPS